MRRLSVVSSLAIALAFLVGAEPVSAQYFGRNKVQYDDFNFKTLEATHFDVYYYPEEKTAVSDAARMAERWYRRHSRTFLREFHEKKPLIFYANSADFQQTNAVRGNLGQGTGGVTESLKERVIMPLTGSYAETDHVLGHELVHSFQYDIALRGDVQNFSLRRLPLWLVEGMAEYLSVGRTDPHTAMWLRDAALRDDLPTVEQMTTQMQSYFPYRYGQAYMAYIGGKYGDAAVANLYKLSGRVGVDSAFVYALGITADSLSHEWKQSVRDTYLEETKTRTPVDSVGQAVLGTPGEKRTLNISPAVSPDGRYVAFISRRDVFNTNLYVADAETGEIIQELEGTKSNPHFDALRFINSAGAWSPDGRRFAFITFADGDNEINTLNVETGEITKRTDVQGVGAIENLAWSPDGGQIAFSGLKGGRTTATPIFSPRGRPTARRSRSPPTAARRGPTSRCSSLAPTASARSTSTRARSARSAPFSAACTIIRSLVPTGAASTSSPTRTGLRTCTGTPSRRTRRTGSRTCRRA
jgi:hypothetical protein